MLIKTLDKYVVRSFLYSLLLWFVVFMSLRIVADLFVNLDEFAEVAEKQGVGTWYLVGQIGSYYFYNSLTYFTEMGGIIILVAAAFSLARMNHTNELTAMLASGVSLYRVVWPIILSAMLMGGLIIIDQEFCIPQVKYKLLREEDEVGGAKKGRPVKLLCDGYNSVWYSNMFDPQEQKLHSPLVVLRDDNFRYAAHAGAKYATFSIFERSPGWLTSDGFLFCKSSDNGKGNVGWRHTQDTSQIYTVISPEALVEIGKKMLGESLPEGKTIGGITDITTRDEHFSEKAYRNGTTSSPWDLTSECRSECRRTPAACFRGFGVCHDSEPAPVFHCPSIT